MAKRSATTEPARADGPIGEVLPALLHERGLSYRSLGARLGKDPTFLSRAVRGARGKRVNAALAAEIAHALELPEDFFREYRVARIVELLRSHPELIDTIYDELRRVAKLR